MTREGILTFHEKFSPGTEKVVGRPMHHGAWGGYTMEEVVLMFWAEQIAKNKHTMLLPFAGGKKRDIDESYKIVESEAMKALGLGNGVSDQTYNTVAWGDVPSFSGEATIEFRNCVVTIHGYGSQGNASVITRNGGVSYRIEELVAV